MTEFDLSTTFFALLAVAANLATVGLVTLLIAGRYSNAASDLCVEVRAALARSGLVIAATVAVAASLGSLYLSERLSLVPCELCWYQRIAMYSLALILVVAAIRRDWAVRPYALALSLVGPVISLYHYLEQRFPDLDAGGCDVSNPCTLTYIWKFGHVSIPFMALAGFALVATILLIGPPLAASGTTDDNNGSEPSEKPLERR